MILRKRGSRILGLLMALTLVLAACGTEGGDDTTTTSPAAGSTSAAAGEAVEIAPAGSIVGTFLGKCTTNPVFPAANDGAVEAAGELESEPTELVGPADCAETTAGIDIVTNAVTQQVDVIMVSNNAGDELAPAAVAAQEAGIPVVTWDSPIPSAEGESVYIAPADLSGAGQTMAEMARSILPRRWPNGNPLSYAGGGEPKHLDRGSGGDTGDA